MILFVLTLDITVFKSYENIWPGTHKIIKSIDKFRKEHRIVYKVGELCSRIKINTFLKMFTRPVLTLY